MDYKRQSVVDWVRAVPGREVDLVADFAGGASASHLWAAVKEGGTILSVVVPPGMVRPQGCAKSVAKSDFFIVESDGAQLAEITKLIDAAGFKPRVDGTYEFTQEGVQAAFKRVDSGETNGKVIIKVGI